jgi:lipopolysaccharide/colanic/teichoic acid biosynthesis glycosyltransferase
MYLGFGKRFLDLFISAAGLIVLAPVLLATGLVVWIGMGTPVLFRQTRPGRNERPFTILKFRTMRVARGEGDAARLTTLGRALRSMSLDELPTLLNVIKGEMSLVGPRPLLVDYLPLYNSTQARRHNVRPGITGLAQVSGRNALSWEERFDLDVRYVESGSLFLDLKILAMTVAKVLQKEGISCDGHATAPHFLGSKRCE